jgi:hypothetical protein
VRLEANVLDMGIFKLEKPGQRSRLASAKDGSES